MSAVLAYEAPVVYSPQDEENEVIPAIIVAAASVVGVSAGFAAWVCSQCPGKCRSLWATIDTLRKWIFTRAGC